MIEENQALKEENYALKSQIEDFVKAASVLQHNPEQAQTVKAQALQIESLTLQLGEAHLSMVRHTVNHAIRFNH